jgi:two-component system response regulator YesN
MRVMVIDDEPIVCKALRQLIPWEEHGFEWVGSADNGEEALEQIVKLYPDLILVDCKMPIMDGLQLLKEIKKRSLHVKAIILSGYNDFMYAQQAIALGASDYLLKPPDLEKLLEVINRVKKEWETETRIKHQLKQHFPVMRERFLFGLLNGAQITLEHFIEKADYLKLQLRNGPFVLALLQIEDESEAYKEYSYEDQQLIHFAVLNIAEETLELLSSKVLFYEENHRFVIIISMDTPEQAALLRHYLQQVIDNVKQTLKLSSTIGTSLLSHSLLTDGNQAYENAKVAIKHKYYTGPDTVIDYGDLQLTGYGTPVKGKMDPAHDEKLRIALKICNGSDLDVWIERFFLFLKEQNISNHETKTLGLQYMISAAHSMIEIHPQLHLDELLRAEQIDSVFSVSTLDELEAIIETYLFHLLSVTQKLRKSGNNAVVEKTKEYIHVHYSRNITLEMIAKDVFVSPVYLSFLFKQVESINLTDYLTHVRIEQAKQLLQTTAYKTYEIAAKVGYHDEKYFSRIFKKKVGITPTEYRNQF